MDVQRAVIAYRQMIIKNYVELITNSYATRHKKNKTEVSIGNYIEINACFCGSPNKK